CAVSQGHSGSPINGKSRRCWLGHVISCVQSQLITWDMYTDHQGTDDQCAAYDLCSPSSATYQCPSVSAVSAHPCHLPVPISATFQCTSMPHISVHLSCLLVSPISASQCHLSVLPISVTPISASQCRLSVPVS
ncbi:unnamed protein product, partial [Staurois parvus]